MSPMRRKRHLKIKRTKSGFGLFTERDIARDDFVIHYSGERITPKESDRRGGRYLFTVNRKLVLDAKDHKHIARYINHSCRPNCLVEIDEKNESIDIYAKRFIPAGSEITYNYGKKYWEDFIGPKHCTCEKCVENGRHRG